jgi:hypothetical protein
LLPFLIKFVSNSLVNADNNIRFIRSEAEKRE